MAKYCSKCGRALPDGVEMCPECHAQGSEQKAAALFTQMTAETEVWKEAPPPGKKPKKVRHKPAARERAMLYTAAVLLVMVTAFVILYTQPAAKVERAIRKGDYDRAVSLYSEKLMGEGKSADESIGRLLEEKAEETLEAYTARTMEEEAVDQQFAGFYAFGLNEEGLDGVYEQFTVLRETRELQDKAEKMIISEEYLDACDLLLTVEEDSSEYEAAQTRASECLEMYAAGILSKAESYMGRNEYAAAIRVLERGNQQLKEYGTYSAYIDGKLDECLDAYEAYALDEAEKLAEMEAYDSAANLLFSCMKSVGETQALSEAFDRYSALAEDKTAADAIARANEFYDAGSYADAFLELEAAGRRLEDSTEVDGAIAALEVRFSAEMRDQAETVLGGDRGSIDAAAEVIQNALGIRELESLEEYAAYLDSLRPLELTSADYKLRQGDIFRSSTAFEALNGGTYSDGWLWGGNEASISFDLAGGYDKLEGTLAVRRDDGKSVSGYFEVWCDGEMKYTSSTLKHDGAPESFSYDISGCQELKLVFYCDYVTSTAEDGFCYHGICSPVVLKNLAE